MNKITTIFFLIISTVVCFMSECSVKQHETVVTTAEKSEVLSLALENEETTCIPIGSSMQDMGISDQPTNQTEQEMIVPPKGVLRFRTLSELALFIRVSEMEEVDLYEYYPFSSTWIINGANSLTAVRNYVKILKSIPVISGEGVELRAVQMTTKDEGVYVLHTYNTLIGVCHTVFFYGENQKEKMDLRLEPEKLERIEPLSFDELYLFTGESFRSDISYYRVMKDGWHAELCFEDCDSIVSQPFLSRLTFGYSDYDWHDLEES